MYSISGSPYAVCPSNSNFLWLLDLEQKSQARDGRTERLTDGVQTLNAVSYGGSHMDYLI